MNVAGSNQVSCYNPMTEIKNEANDTKAIQE
jgi:hypothetical protein